MVFGRVGDLWSCRDHGVVLRRRFPKRLNRRRHREQPRSPTWRRHWHTSLLPGYGWNRGWLSRCSRSCCRRRVARNAGRTASAVARASRRLRGARLRWRLLTRLRRCGRSRSRNGQASGRPLSGRSALATARPGRLISRLLLPRCASLRRAATRDRSRSARLLCRWGLSTAWLRCRRLGRCGRGALSG